MTEQIELPPLPDGYREALARCRFVTPNIAHTRAWAYTQDEDTAAMLSASKYQRAKGVAEWEATIIHPEAVALAVELAAENPHRVQFPIR